MAKKTRKRVTKASGAAGTTRGLSGISIDDLAKEMQRRQREMNKLVSRRDRLIDQVNELNAQIQGLGGSAAMGSFGLTAGGKPRRRPRNEQNLSEALIGVLKGNTLSVTEAAEAVQRAGYQTTSSSFRTIVNQTLIKDPRFKKVSRGKYTAK